MLFRFFISGAALNRDLIPTLKIGVIVSDSMAPKAVNAIFDYTYSAKNGPAVGQITVLDIETTLPIGRNVLTSRARAISSSLIGSD
jgi:nitrogen regulatory protein PII